MKTILLKHKNISILQIIIPVIFTMVLFIGTFSVIILPFVKKNMMSSKRKIVKELISTSCTLLNDYNRRVIKGELSLKEAKKRAVARIRELRYGSEQKDYFWINDMHPIMIMHPYRPELEGNDLTDFKDPNGKRLFVEFVKTVKAKGSGYVDYMWQFKDDSKKVVPKISYVKLFKPWGWIIGTGIYIEDLKKEINEIIGTSQNVFILIFFIVLILLVYIVRINLKMQQKNLIYANALMKSEAKFRGLVESSSDLIWEVNNTCSYIYMSPQVEKILGFKPYEVLNKKPYEFMPKKESRKVKKQLIKKTEPIICLESCAIDKNGQEIILETSCFPYFNDNNKLLGYRGVSRDITNRKKTEKELIEMNARLSGIFNSTVTIGFIGVEADGTINLFSCGAEKMLGYSAKEIIGKATPFLFHLDSEIVEFRKKINKKIGYQTEGFDLFNEAAKIYKNKNTEWTWINKHGKKLTVLLTFTTIHDHVGNISGRIAVAQDITERKKQEVELHNLRNYLNNIIDSMPSVLIGVDTGGLVTQWNKKAEEVTKINSDKAIGNMLSDVFPKLKPELKKIKQSIQSKEIKQEQKKSLLFEEGAQYEDVIIYPLIADGVEGAVIRIDDVTDKVRLEEMMIQSEKMLSVGGLAAGMAHEINNPLAGIIQTANVMESRLNIENKIPANIKAAEKFGTTMEAIGNFMNERGIIRMISTINESGQRVAEIVENMLSFARKSDYQKTSHYLEDILDKTLELASTDYDLKKHYDFKKIDIVKKYDKSIPSVPCERAKIQQVILNILHNGAQAMQSAHTYKPKFIISTKFDKERKLVCVVIQDNGPGMDEKVRKRIFEPFFTTKPTGQGTGLGLSVSYFIITENHGGEMFVETKPGKGATFTICLPLGLKSVN